MFKKYASLTVRELIEITIAVATAIEYINNKKAHENELSLKEAIRCLNAGVGNGYVAEDYYAPARYYTDRGDYKIKGVKNIRLVDEEVWVKVTAPSGYLVPESINLDGVVYTVRFIKSEQFTEEVDC